MSEKLKRKVKLKNAKPKPKSLVLKDCVIVELKISPEM
jgi:hypothetical protein